MTTASRIAADVATGTVTAAQVTEEALYRAERATDLNLFTHLDHDGAWAAARRVDDIVAADGDPGPLGGVPVVLKDLIDHTGRATTCGSSFYRQVAERSATVVERLESAGAVIIGRVGLHEFAYGFSSENAWFGPVRNPLDPATSPGGSSGGSAAAVAAGVAPIGIGTDTGGSVRVPAALCGLVGLKVTHGRVPLTGVFPLMESVDTVGPITATVADAALAYLVMAGHDPADPHSADRPVDQPAGAVPISDLTIGVPHPWVDRPMEAGIAAAWATALDVLADAGATIRHLEAPDLQAERIDLAVMWEVAQVHRAWFAEDRSRYGSEVADRLEPVMAYTEADFAAALEWRDGARRVASGVFDDVDLLVTPSTAARRKVIGEPMVDGGEGPEPYRRALSWFSMLVNHLGLPALSLPIGQVGTPPPSLQLIAPWWKEAYLLSVGFSVEALFQSM